MSIENDTKKGGKKRKTRKRHIKGKVGKASDGERGGGGERTGWHCSAWRFFGDLVEAYRVVDRAFEPASCVLDEDIGCSFGLCFSSYSGKRIDVSYTIDERGE